MFGRRATAVAATLMTLSAFGEPAQKLPLKNRFDPLPGITTSGQPTSAELQQLPKEGFKTVINLRTPGESEQPADEADQVTRAGMRYFQLPVAGADDVTEANARKLGELLSTKEALPALVHCASANRVGALLALKSFYVDGQGVETSMALGKKAGLAGLERTVRTQLEKAQAERARTHPSAK